MSFMPKASSTRGKIAAFYAKVAAFSIEDLFSTKHEPGPPRTIYVNEELPHEWLALPKKQLRQYTYSSNQVITSKYTIITFLPRNLLEQFRRIANIFFLALSILQFFPKFATISPGVVILPLAIILALTALKDGYEDFKRHQSDNTVNHSTVKVLSGDGWHNPNMMQAKSKTFIRGMLPAVGNKPSIKRPSTSTSASSVSARSEAPSYTSDAPPPIDPDIEYDYPTPTTGGPHWRKTYFEDVKVGDFVKIHENESFPADILICASSDDDNVAYVETKNLDGETNLKSRNAVPQLTGLNNALKCADQTGTASFSIHCDRPETNMYRLNSTITFPDGKKASADLQTMLLRGTVLRNTAWVIGVVLFTGEETKIVMNSGVTPSKRSRVERKMNPQVFFNLFIIAALATVNAIVDSQLEKQDFPRGAPWLYDDNRSGDNPSVNGIVTWAYSILTFQDVVPISLYLSIEVVRTLQALLIYFDKEIAYTRKNSTTGKVEEVPTLARSWNLSDDLGQVQYIFSDKTGTLTQNSMVFRQCTIGGKAYYGDPKPTHNDREHSGHKRSASSESTDSQAHERKGLHAPPPDSLVEDNTFHDALLSQDIEAALGGDNHSSEPYDAAHARSINGFFSVLALCHTVVPSVDPLTGNIRYKSQSPDEAALVQAAADCGFVFLANDRGVLSMRTPGSGYQHIGPRHDRDLSAPAPAGDNPDEDGIEKYELLNILEFTSARKRMSVIVRKLSGADRRIFLMCKGADNVIFERLKGVQPGGRDEETMKRTESQLSEFANNGLRTLTLAYKVISEEDYNEWNERYHQATVSLGDSREDLIEEVSSSIEKDLRLLGASAIEDKLQDGVPETIADLKRAGIKIWVATGDKLETAIAIGRSTNLVSHDSNIIVLRGGMPMPLEAQINKASLQFFPDEMETRIEHLYQPRPSTTSRDADRPSSRPQLLRTNTGLTDVVGEENGERPGGFVLVVDGAGLLEAFRSEETKKQLLRLGMLCEGVICCRVSPLQKALIVRLVKDGLGVMTLAIGDGANDVSMIQAADVGVGISGEEGLQAVNSSDYAIAQFRFLKKLILVHGHWSYARNGIMILNFFYKNIVPTGVLWWFQIYNGFSGSFAFDYTYILFWNSFWTLLPVCAIGLFDRFLDASLLMDIPELYHYGREGYWFSMTQFYIYLIDGVYQSVIIFFFSWFTYVTTSTRSDGWSIALSESGIIMAISGVLIVDLFAGLSATAWTWWMAFGVFFGIVVVWVFTLVYDAISPGYSVTALYGNNTFVFTSAAFWLLLPLTIFLSLAPRMIAKAAKFAYRPDDIDIVRAIRKRDPNFDFTENHEGELGIGLKALKRQQRTSSITPTPSGRHSRAESTISVSTIEPVGAPGRPSLDVRCASRTDMSTGVVSTDRGFNFSAEEGGVAMKRMQSNLSERRIQSNRSLQKLPVHHEERKMSTLGHVFSLRRGIGKSISLRRKPTDAAGRGSHDTDEGEHHDGER